MRKLYKPKMLLILGALLVVFVIGCVDTGVQTIPDTITYNSQIKIVNLISGAGTVTLALDGKSLGTAALGGEAPNSSGFLEIQSGNRILNISYNSTAFDSRFTADTDYKIRIFLVGTAASNEIIKNVQRYIWQTKDSNNGSPLFPADTGQIAIFNGSPDAVLSGISYHGGTLTDTITTTFDSPLAMGESMPYMFLHSGTYSFDISYGDSSHTTFDYDLKAKGRYTAVIYDMEANLKNAVLVDD